MALVLRRRAPKGAPSTTGSRRYSGAGGSSRYSGIHGGGKKKGLIGMLGSNLMPESMYGTGRGQETIYDPGTPIVGRSGVPPVIPGPYSPGGPTQNLGPVWNPGQEGGGPGPGADVVDWFDPGHPSDNITTPWDAQGSVGVLPPGAFGETAIPGQEDPGDLMRKYTGTKPLPDVPGQDYPGMEGSDYEPPPYQEPGEPYGTGGTGGWNAPTPPPYTYIPSRLDKKCRPDDPFCK